MNKLFEIIFLDEAYEFLKGLERKHYEKILYNIRKAQTERDSKLFKKITDDPDNYREGVQNFIPRTSIPITCLLGQNFHYSNVGYFDTWFCEKEKQSSGQ